MQNWLFLPEVKHRPWVSVTAQYGAICLAADYCGLDRSTPTRKKLIWKHGWQPDYLTTVDPICTATESVDDPQSTRILVARQIEANYLISNGFPLARAVGLPICYSTEPEKSLERRSNTLLVVPVHSLDMTSHHWKFDEYVEQIASVRNRFDEVIACVHPSCIRNGYWINEFKSKGIECISGADTRDINALNRMRWLFSQFEFVTTNGITSSIVYASAFGAKVSIFGPHCRVSVDDVEDLQFYHENPGLAEKVMPYFSEEIVRSHLSDFYTHPADAISREAWGRNQIGMNNVVSPSELKSLIFEAGSVDSPKARKRWITRQRVKRLLPPLISDFARSTFKSVCTLVSSDSGGESLDRSELERLQSRPRGESGVVDLSTGRFYYRDAVTFSREYTSIFLHRLYDFPCIYESPLVIDCGANIGIASRYWLSVYPKARVVAIEPNVSNFEYLERNLSQFSHQSRCFNAAIWKEAGRISFSPIDSETGFVSQLNTSKREVPSTLVNAIKLSELLSGRVDFLKVDIEGAECDVIIEAASALQNVKRLWIEYHSLLAGRQRLGQLLDVLEKNGFRYHIIPQRWSQRPFERVEAECGMDQRLNIWATRAKKFHNTVYMDS
jgi:FkbM family methyltransferase